MDKEPQLCQFAIIGMGRDGSSVAGALHEAGWLPKDHQDKAVLTLHIFEVLDKLVDEHQRFIGVNATASVRHEKRDVSHINGTSLLLLASQNLINFFRILSLHKCN